ncbi:MAG: pantoate--beta-alanine ligase [Chitinophagales bacterium]
MLIFKKTTDLQAFLKKEKAENKQIGFVPTMGALHKGHLSLIAQSKATTAITVCSIFVNPTQFDDENDLIKYPRTTEKDITLLKKKGCEVLFLPSVEEIYPANETIEVDYDFGYLEKPMEGAHRQGHFKGVAQVVNRLLEIVKPNQLFMGQKDYQQFKIIGKLLELTDSDVQLVKCDIVREKDGLAMSSRNARLSAEQRQKAPVISQILQWVKNQYGIDTPQGIEVEAIQKLNQVEGFDTDYLKVVNAETLQEVETWTEEDPLIVCTAVRLGKIRLIDNMLF